MLTVKPGRGMRPIVVVDGKAGTYACYRFAPLRRECYASSVPLSASEIEWMRTVPIEEIDAWARGA